MSLSRYDISELIKKDFLHVLQDYKLVQKTITLPVSGNVEQTVVEYAIEKKDEKAEENR